MHKKMEKTNESSAITDVLSKELFSSLLNNRFTILYGLRRSGKTFFIKNMFLPFFRDQTNILCDCLDFEKLSRLGLKGDDEYLEYIKSRSFDVPFLILDEVSLFQNFPALFRLLKSFPETHFLLVSSVSIDYLDFLKRKKDSGLSFFYFSSLLFLDSEADFLDLKNDFLPSLRVLSSRVQKDSYLEKLINLISLPDIAKREGVRTIYVLKRILSLLSSRVGQYLNSSLLSELYFSLYDRSVDFKTVEKYLSGLEKSFLIKRISRMDLKDNKVLGGLYKYYFQDLSVQKFFEESSKSPNKDSLEALVALILESRNIPFWNGFFYSFFTNEKGKRARKPEYIDFAFYQEKNLVLVQAIPQNMSFEQRQDKEETLGKIKRRALRIMLCEEKIESQMDKRTISYLSVPEFCGFIKFNKSNKT